MKIRSIANEKNLFMHNGVSRPLFKCVICRKPIGSNGNVGQKQRYNIGTKATFDRTV